MKPTFKATYRKPSALNFALKLEGGKCQCDSCKRKAA